MNLTPQQRQHLFFSSLLMLGGILLAIYGFNNQSRFERLAKEGKSVMSLPMKEYKEVRSRKGQPDTYVVEPSFIAEDGKTYTCKGGISKEKMAEVEDSLTVMVNYVPTDPNLCKVEGALVNENSSDSEGAMFGGVITFLGALIYLWRKVLKKPKLV